MINPENARLLFVTLAVLGILAGLARRRDLTVPLFALSIFNWMVVSTFFSIDPYRSIVGKHGFWIGGLWPTLILITLSGLRPRGSRWLWILGCVLSVHAVAQRLDLTRSGFYSPPNHMGSFIGDHLTLGAILAMAGAVAPWSALTIISAGLWSVGSRGAFIALLVARLPGRWKLAPLLFAAALPLLKMSPSDRGRLEIWKIAAHSAIEHPLLGSGPETFEFTYRQKLEHSENSMVQAYAHNALLEALATTGVIGALLLVLLGWDNRHDRALQALAAFSMFNPVGFAALALGALRARCGERIDGRPFALFTVALSLPWLTMLWLAQVSTPANAQRLMPRETTYAMKANRAGTFDPELGDLLVRDRRNDPEAHYVRSLMALRAGDKDRATSEIEAARQLDPTYGPIRYIDDRLHGRITLK